MKKQRHKKILEIVAEHAVTTQEELLSRLGESGLDVAQATVSRDIKELKLFKTADNSGVLRYTARAVMEEPAVSKGIFGGSVISITCAMNSVVIKCRSGMASAACAVIDALNLSEVVGTLAGDDTIFIIALSERDATRIAKRLEELR